MIVVDARSTVAPFEQVRSQLAAQIADGTLVVGTKLPTVRSLADELGLAVNTVARAYRELETSGLVETRGRAGTVVTSAGDRVRADVAAAARVFAKAVHDSGLDTDSALRIVRAAL